MKKYFPVIILSFIIFFSFFVLSNLIYADQSILNISAQVNSTNPGGGGGGGGGGGSLPPPQNTKVHFAGRAYPLSKVTILRDGQLAVTTIAGPDAVFDVSINLASAGNYNFSVYSEDSKGLRSETFSFPIIITLGVTVDVTGIFISPTIDVDKSQVKKGDNLTIFGQSIPTSKVVISVHSPVEEFHTVNSDKNGAYLFRLDTSPLVEGQHATKSKTVLLNDVSPYGKVVNFIVGEENLQKDILCGAGIGDINCDGKVNIIDFSIVAFWYNKKSPPLKVDLNKDSKVNLIDLSILAYHWTG